MAAPFSLSPVDTEQLSGILKASSKAAVLESKSAGAALDKILKASSNKSAVLECKSAGAALDDVSILEVPTGGKLYGLLCAHISKFSATSFRIEELDGPSGDDSDKCCGGQGKGKAHGHGEEKKVKAEEQQEERFRFTKLGLGLGAFRFRSPLLRLDGDDGGDLAPELIAVHQTRGEPVGTQCGAVQMTSLVIVAPGAGRQRLLQRLCERLIAASERVEANTITIYRWHNRHHYWRRESRTLARPLKSVVLPAGEKAGLLRDFEDFFEDETRSWYAEHGIPYRRSYLFHGVPGTGKTSLIGALAGRFGRNVCFLQPSHPEMTDDALKAAVQRVPERSFIVFEDIDSLFDKQRNNKVSGSRLTFSGLLNALDGVGSPKGQVFVLTTNFRDQLDDALTRNGRVDRHVEFTHATGEQFGEMFRQFYPAASEELVGRFVHALRRHLGEGEGDANVDANVDGEKKQDAEKEEEAPEEEPAPKQRQRRRVTTAMLQHFFVQSRKRTAAEAVAAVGDVVKELDARGGGGASAKDGAKDGAKDENKAKAKKAGAKAGRRRRGKRGRRGKATGGRGHIHIHLHGAGGGGGESAEDDGASSEDEEE